MGPAQDAHRPFFLNYYYGAFMTVNTLALDLINQGMPDTYAAMSPYEFFAELYALFYDLDDPQRDNIPKEVVKWMKKHIGAATANQPARPSLQPARRRSRGIARPAAAY
jgi:hypothetical protein